MPQPELSQEDLLRRITNRIRQSLELQEILTATVAELRSLLGTDRVIVYRFHESGSGEVIAESIQDNCLPSLHGLNFPADDIPESARQLYIERGLCSLVDVSSERIGFLPVDSYLTGEEGTTTLDNIEYRPLDPCHAAYLAAMGVQSSIVLPIVHSSVQSGQSQEWLWGLLVSHNTQGLVISRSKLQIMQWVLAQVSIAIAQSHLLEQTRQQHFVEATTNRIATLLHSLPTIELQAALEETVAALQGCGGRLYIVPYKTDETPELFSCGTQLAPLNGETDSLIEQHPAFMAWISSNHGSSTQQGLEDNKNRGTTSVTGGERSPMSRIETSSPTPKTTTSSIPPYTRCPFSASCEPLVVTDLYKIPELRVLTPAFAPTKIRGMVLLPLYYRSSFLGILSIFRPEVDTETLWAGRFDPSERQQLPRQSFEVWRELKRGQSKEWTRRDIELAIALGRHFAMAIEQYELYSLVRSLNANLEYLVEERTAKLQQALEQGRAVERVTNQIRSTLDLNTILQTIVREVRNLLNADRVVIYQFTSESEGQVIVESKDDDWLSTLGRSDPRGYFLETSTQPYQRSRVRVISDVSRAALTSEHRAFLQRFQIQAALIVPIGVGAHHSNEQHINPSDALSLQDSSTSPKALLPFALSTQSSSQHKGEQPLWGLLIAQECRTPRSWQAFEIELLQQLADQAAVAIQQAELYEQSRASAAKATEQAQQLTVALENLKQAQTQLIQTEKMSSLGQLVAGVAHEINNPVNFIYGNLTYTNQYANDLLNLLHLYQKYYPRPAPEIDEYARAIDLDFVNEDLPKILASMKIGAERIRKLVLSLRNFSRLDQAEMKAVDIHEGLESTLLILQHRLKVKPNSPGIEVMKNYGELPLVECYASQLNQVFMNVLSNAIDALEEYNATRSPEEIKNKQSQIAISTSVKEVSLLARDRSESNSAYPSPTASHIVVQIADNGPGISPAVQAQIFDPFFTTKPIGKGTGLGLSISYQIIVEKHGGIFQCESQLEQGTRFWIEIPVRQPPCTEERALLTSTSKINANKS
ncbi:MAG TPA: GAF domain-containing protein [Coleofasciculaceae cyanobacterium]